MSLAKTLSTDTERKKKTTSDTLVLTPVQHSQSQDKLTLALLPMLTKVIRKTVGKSWIWKFGGHQPLFLQVLQRRQIVLTIAENLVCNKCATDHKARAPQELKVVLPYWSKAELWSISRSTHLFRLSSEFLGLKRHPEQCELPKISHPHKSFQATSATW